MAKSKKELDKDLMFKKIMPALSENPFSSTYSQNKSPSYEETNSEKFAPENPNDLSALKNKLFARSDTFVNTAYASTINVMENLVLKNLDTAIKRFNTCNCDRCRADISAYALNLLPPKYIVATEEKIHLVEQEIPNKIVMDALIKAVIAVRSHPRH